MRGACPSNSAVHDVGRLGLVRLARGGLNSCLGAAARQVARLWPCRSSCGSRSPPPRQRPLYPPGAVAPPLLVELVPTASEMSGEASRAPARRAACSRSTWARLEGRIAPISGNGRRSPLSRLLSSEYQRCVFKTSTSILSCLFSFSSSMMRCCSECGCRRPCRPAPVIDLIQRCTVEWLRSYSAPISLTGLPRRRAPRSAA